MIYIDENDLIAAATVILDGKPAVRDMGLLASAVSRPSASTYGEEAYPGIHEKAAALLIGVVNNHPLIDGNKRLGWVATRLFYAYNDKVLRMDTDDAYRLVMSIAKGEQDDVHQVAVLLSSHVI